MNVSQQRPPPNLTLIFHLFSFADFNRVILGLHWGNRIEFGPIYSENSKYS